MLPLMVEAENEADAWAMNCDQQKHWPSPKLRIVTEIKEETDVT
jgi:hypothetical protein